jgi:hypothetical protein
MTVVKITNPEGTVSTVQSRTLRRTDLAPVVDLLANFTVKSVSVERQNGTYRYEKSLTPDHEDGTLSS